MIEYIGSDPKIPLAKAVRAGDWLYISGQASTESATGAFVPGTFEEEFARSIQNLRDVVRDAGSTFDRIVRVGAYVRDESALTQFNELYLRAFAHPRPARTTTAMGFEFLQFEIDAVAYLGD